ncbi:ZIP family metal transporter [Desulforamulus aeronauticus]|uniref:Zinc transporter, ZIP family n=1 Tax=Desulforamulus aeronauticus DSM 10349 TaxID=1121421 RepID=A0A1M6X4V6_9FIRM|nr:ZIP family metal transporter [Desulforamulus aeronauticus]SHL00879.1 zinc transporter, ZIP family [Desulforamulus aeronauticus DSM 10349]
MNSLLFSTMMGFGVGGVGVGLGGLVACGIDRRSEKTPWLILSVAAGMIFALLGLELLPESVRTGGYLVSLSGIITGLLFIFLLEQVSHRVVIITSNPRRSRFIRSGLWFALGIAIHNFPVGFAMGTSLVNQPRMGFDLATTMLFHNFPEGLAMSLPFIIAGVNRLVIPMLASVVSVPSGLGAFLGTTLNNPNGGYLAFICGIAIGTILFVTWHEILGHARKKLVLPTLVPCLLVGLLLGKLITFLLE